MLCHGKTKSPEPVMASPQFSTTLLLCGNCHCPLLPDSWVLTLGWVPQTSSLHFLWLMLGGFRKNSSPLHSGSAKDHLVHQVVSQGRTGWVRELGLEPASSGACLNSRPIPLLETPPSPCFLQLSCSKQPAQEEGEGARL